MKQTPPSRRGRRAGVAYVLAMLYLLLFTVLAIGFCAASSMSLQIGRNERSISDAQSAAESGMAFVRGQLGHVAFRSTISADELAPLMEANLAARLNGSATMKGRDIRAMGNVIWLPGENEWTMLDRASGTRFQAQISTDGMRVWVKVIGRGESETIRRAVQMEFKPAPREEKTPELGSRLVADAGTYEEVSP